MEIVFIRHAEKEDIGEDPHLTKRGIKQARYIGKILKDEKFKYFFCSSMNRAKETAAVIAKIIKLNPKVEPSLNEFKAEILKNNKGLWDRREKKRYKELISFLDKITLEREKEISVLIIGHGNTNRIILSYLLGLQCKGIIQFRQAEGSINIVYWFEKFKNWRLKVWNDNSHIPKNLRYSKTSY